VAERSRSDFADSIRIAWIRLSRLAAFASPSLRHAVHPSKPAGMVRPRAASALRADAADKEWEDSVGGLVHARSASSAHALQGVARLVDGLTDAAGPHGCTGIRRGFRQGRTEGF